MEYQRASLIRGSSLSGLIGERYAAGQNIGSSIGGAISDKFKAKAVGIKEYFDPLSWVRAATGRGAFGNIATAVAGRAMGRSQRDIAYFGGYVRRRSTIPSLQSGGISGSNVGDSVSRNSEMLEKIFQFLKRSSDERKRTEQIARAFRQEQVNEDNRRHNQLVRAIQSFTSPKVKRNFVDDDMKIPFRSLFDDLLNTLKNLFEKILGKMALIGAGLSGKKAGGPKPGAPEKETAKTGAVADSKSKRFKESLTKAEIEELEKKGIKYDEKTGVFRKEGKLIKTESVAQELGETGLKKLAEAKSAGQKVVGEAVEKTISKKTGLKSILKKIPLVGLAFGSMFGIARAMEGDTTGAVAEVVSGVSGAIPVVGTAAGLAVDAALIARDVYKNLYGVFPEDDDPDLREERKQEIVEILEEKLKSISTSPTETNLDTTDALSQGIENTGSASTYTESPSTETKVTATRMPAGESLAGAGRGIIAGPTAADMQSAPAPVPTPIPRVMPDIAPVPEMPPVSMSTQPIVQTNTHTNVIGGSKDRVLATSTPKQRNADLNRFLSNSSVAV